MQSPTIRSIYADAFRAIQRFLGCELMTDDLSKKLPLVVQFALIKHLSDKVHRHFHPDAVKPSEDDAIMKCIYNGLLPHPEDKDTSAWASRVQEVVRLGLKRSRDEADIESISLVEGARPGSKSDEEARTYASTEATCLRENEVLEMEMEALHNAIAQDQLFVEKIEEETRSLMKLAAEEKTELGRQELEASREEEKNNTLLKRIAIEQEQHKKHDVAV